jgi:hypothetical protein
MRQGFLRPILRVGRGPPGPPSRSASASLCARACRNRSTSLGSGSPFPFGARAVVGGVGTSMVADATTPTASMPA